MANLPVPVPRTFSPSETETAAYLNSVRDALLFLLNPPLLETTQAAAQTLTNGVWAAIAQDATGTDTYGMHSNVTNNTRATAQVAGWYWPSGAVAFASNTAGARGARFAKNGTAVAGTAAFGSALNVAGATGYGAVSLPISLGVGDYVEIQGYQTSGGNLNTFTSSDVNSSLALFFLHA